MYEAASAMPMMLMVRIWPKAPGLRQGAVMLYDTDGNLVGTSYISGIGDAPLGLLTQGTHRIVIVNVPWYLRKRR